MICFGGIHITDIEVIDLVDVTDATVYAPNLGAFDSRLGAIESQRLDPRVTDVETSIGAPNTKTYPSRVAAQSETVPATATTLRTLGYLISGDGGDDFYSRTGSGAGDFQTNNGSVGWRRVVGPAKPEQFGGQGRRHHQRQGGPRGGLRLCPGEQRAPGPDPALQRRDRHAGGDLWAITVRPARMRR